jgi:RNA polymerase sigma-70 factor (sigma-E family)
MAAILLARLETCQPPSRLARLLVMGALSMADPGMADPGSGASVPGALRRPSEVAGPRASDDALTDLYAAHWVGLVRLAALLLRDRSRAEEVVQDAFIAAYPRLARLREEGTALAYLRRSVVNGCRSGFRRHGVEERYLTSVKGSADAPGRASGDSAETTALRHHDDAALLEAVHRLPQRQREVVVLRYYADLSEQQIADALDIAAGSVKAHAHRALTTLRTTLGGAS